VVVVSDTTAITSLLKIGRAVLLRDLFHRVVIPEAVRDELLKYHTTIPDFIEVKAVVDRLAIQSLRRELGFGEAEAIILAEESGADALLIDEKLGRSIAERRGVRCLGLAGAPARETKPAYPERCCSRS
jgi:predicted nucleic acid-binding protein